MFLSLIFLSHLRSQHPGSTWSHIQDKVLGLLLYIVVGAAVVVVAVVEAAMLHAVVVVVPDLSQTWSCQRL